MILITESEIDECKKHAYVDDGVNIVGKHNPFNGEKDFALCQIEQMLGLLHRKEIDDEKIIIYTKDLFSLSKVGNTVYKDFLDAMAFHGEYKHAVEMNKYNRLSIQDKRILHEMMQSNFGEYWLKGEYQSCCYSAMITFLVCTYCLLIRNIDFSIKSIEMIVDIDDELLSINVFKNPNNSDDSVLIVTWHSTNRINNVYLLYKTQYIGLDKSSILDLVAADVIEEDYYINDERFTIAPSILVKQYCAIIEHEVNQIIQLKNLKDKPKNHLMWKEMKDYVRKNKIKLEGVNFRLIDLLNDLYLIRNDAMHGEIITNERYKIIQEYKVSLFQGISITKLVLQNKKIKPTIDELKEYMGLE